MATEEGTQLTEKVFCLMSRRRGWMINAKEKREEWITRGA